MTENESLPEEKTNLDPDKQNDSRFIVDGMLGSIARKLRIIGFDTVYSSNFEDGFLLEEALNSGRILVTSDIELFLRAKRKKTATILVSSRIERDRLYEILASLGEKRIDLRSLKSRCSTCNGRLKKSASLLNEKIVFECISCGKTYWRGGHWEKLTRLFREVNFMLQNEQNEMLRENQK
ncbi:MAG: hypothetical protein OK439_04930 [Thaumarchaeota archaeon]|nr:hypothetical protein [Nitrososphaerota archaeon]